MIESTNDYDRIGLHVCGACIKVSVTVFWLRATTKCVLHILKVIVRGFGLELPPRGRL